MQACSSITRPGHRRVRALVATRCAASFDRGHSGHYASVLLQAGCQPEPIAADARAACSSHRCNASDDMYFDARSVSPAINGSHMFGRSPLGSRTDKEDAQLALLKECCSGCGGRGCRHRRRRGRGPVAAATATALGSAGPRPGPGHGAKSRAQVRSQGGRVSVTVKSTLIDFPPRARVSDVPTTNRGHCSRNWKLDG